MEPKRLLSLQNPLVKHLVKLRKETDYRNESERVVIEGIKLILEMKDKVLKLFFTSSCKIHAEDFFCEKWEVTDAIFEKISGLYTPDGMLAEVQKPSFVRLDKEKRVLAFDGVSDPGNLGTLLRSSLAFGWEAVYFLPGCCDPFNEKALRAAKGAHFKLRLGMGTHDHLMKWVQSSNAQALVADLSGECSENFAPSNTRLLVLGNEAHGPSNEIRNFCKTVAIPMSGNMESLNVAVAGGILLYLLKRSVA